MALYSFQATTQVPVAVADTVAFTNNQNLCLAGGGTTQLIKISEVYVGGQATTTAAMLMVLARNTVIQAAGTPVTIIAPYFNGPLWPQASLPAVVPVVSTNATTPGQRSGLITLGRLNFSFNAWGGVVDWKCAQNEEFVLYGNATNVGEVSLTPYTGSTASTSIGAHIVYEPF